MRAPGEAIMTRAKPFYALALLLLCGAVALAEPEISLPKEVIGQPGQFIMIPATTSGSDVKWYSCDSGLALFPSQLLRDNKTAIAIASKPGRYRLLAWTAKGDLASEAAVCILVIGDVPPVPPIPPGPNPPVPPVPPVPVPIPGDGLRVLMVYETAQPITAAHRAVLAGLQVRSYLTAKCAKNGTVPEWRVYDKDVNLSNESKVWQDAMKRPRSSLPWIVISNGTAGYEGPLPPTVDDALKLLAKYGG